MYKDNYTLIGNWRNSEDSRLQLYLYYADLFKLPYQHIFTNPDDIRQVDLWPEVEKYKFKIKKKYFQLKQENDNSIILKEVKE